MSQRCENNASTFWELNSILTSTFKMYMKYPIFMNVGHLKNGYRFVANFVVSFSARPEETHER